MDQYTGTGTKAEDGDHDDDWTKEDEIRIEDETTKDEDRLIDDQTDRVYKCILLSLFSYGYILADIFGKSFFSN